MPLNFATPTAKCYQSNMSAKLGATYKIATFGDLADESEALSEYRGRSIEFSSKAIERGNAEGADTCG